MSAKSNKPDEFSVFLKLTACLMYGLSSGILTYINKSIYT